MGDKLSAFMEPVSSEFLRGTLKTIVLKLLSEQDKMYGYQITQAVKERTHGELTLTFGALYPVLHKLEQEGLLINESIEVDGRLRKYYSLTDSGTQMAIQKISEFERFVDYMQQLFQTPPNLAFGN
ncbi:helix-turn-helix transcriptional regulator [Spirosoma migulaei]